jgi:hypothetical protein
MEFDFLDPKLAIRITDGGERRIKLRVGSVASFHAEVLDSLETLGVPVAINPVPNELPQPTPFPQDHAPRDFDPEQARQFWLALVQIDRVFKRFRTRFLGKCSPVHFFWGSFDFAVTRFSGRTAPAHPGGIPHLPDTVTREAYSHEVSSAGFWPGGPGIEEPCFYSYAYPTPSGFAEAPVAPTGARFEPKLGEFVLPYEAVRSERDPDAFLLAFLQSTYEAAANLAHWDRASLECPEGQAGVPRAIA